MVRFTFYAFVSAEKLGLDVCSAKTRDLVAAASAVTEAVGSGREYPMLLP